MEVQPPPLPPKKPKKSFYYHAATASLVALGLMFVIQMPLNAMGSMFPSGNARIYPGFTAIVLALLAIPAIQHAQKLARERQQQIRR